MAGNGFRTTWLPLQDGFFRVARHFLGNDEDAADAVQDLYVKLWNSRKQMDGILNPKAYGIKLMRNLCLDRLRHAKVARTEDMEAADHEEDGRRADSDMLDRETLDRLDEAMASLPERQREVLEMRVIQKMSYPDMAARLGASELSLRVSLSTARKTLRKRMEYGKK